MSSLRGTCCFILHCMHYCMHYCPVHRYDLSDWSGSILAQCAHESVRVASGLVSRSVAPAKQASDWDSTQVGGADIAQDMY